MILILVLEKSKKRADHRDTEAERSAGKEEE
jgi:hypothetical protein